MKSKQVILFDGVCNLCNSSVNFVIDRDKKDVFRFAALQSEEGRQVLENANIKENYLDSIVLLKDGKLFSRSTAALLIARELSGLWPVLTVFFVIPGFLRDIIYNFIARNRYRWFGKKDECRIPTPELKSKFLSAQVA